MRPTLRGNGQEELKDWKRRKERAAGKQDKEDQDTLTARLRYGHTRRYLRLIRFITDIPETLPNSGDYYRSSGLHSCRYDLSSYQGNTDSKDIMATIMDLVRKKRLPSGGLKPRRIGLKRIQEKYMISLIDGVSLMAFIPMRIF